MIKGWQSYSRDMIPSTKHTYWGEIDPWLIDELYLHEKFEDFFNDRAGKSQNG
jgi:hypothetical protein